MKTVSELLFEQICREKGVSFSAVQCGPERTPDYTILLAGLDVVVEIKELESNKEDLERQERVFTEKNVVAFFPAAKTRVRQKIKSSGKQLKKHGPGETSFYPRIIRQYRRIRWSGRR